MLPWVYTQTPPTEDNTISTQSLARYSAFVFRNVTVGPSEHIQGSSYIQKKQGKKAPHGNSILSDRAVRSLYILRDLLFESRGLTNRFPASFRQSHNTGITPRLKNKNNANDSERVGNLSEVTQVIRAGASPLVSFTWPPKPVIFSSQHCGVGSGNIWKFYLFSCFCATWSGHWL